MLARIVENWLTSARELDYQAAFTQLLSAEGYRVLHAPTHHPFEHGKDVIAVDTSGELHAFQLKGGNIDLGDIDRVQGQLFALAATALTYPGVEPPRAPDRAFLVTNGRLTAPARDRLRSLNDGNRQRAIAPVEVIEIDQLVGRLVSAHGSYLPDQPGDLNDLLRFVLADGAGSFPVKDFASFIWGILQGAGKPRTGGADLRRALASVTIVTSYATGPWQRAGNHLRVAEGWLA